MIRKMLVVPLAVSLVLAALGNVAVAAKHSGAKERKARVAGEQIVVVANSRFSSSELAKKRPRMEALIPEKR